MTNRRSASTVVLPHEQEEEGSVSQWNEREELGVKNECYGSARSGIPFASHYRVLEIQSNRIPYCESEHLSSTS